MGDATEVSSERGLIESQPKRRLVHYVTTKVQSEQSGVWDEGGSTRGKKVSRGDGTQTVLHVGQTLPCGPRVPRAKESARLRL